MWKHTEFLNLDKCRFQGTCDVSASKFFVFEDNRLEVNIIIGVCKNHYNNYLHGDSAEYKEISYNDAIVLLVMAS